jgi:hypothetical protein
MSTFLPRLFVLPELASTQDPLDLYLLSGWDYRSTPIQWAGGRGSGGSPSLLHQGHRGGNCCELYP